MVKRNMQKFKSKKRRNQTELSLPAMLIDGAAGVLIGIICAFVLLVFFALILKLYASGLNTGTGLVLSAKIIASFIGATISIRKGGRLTWIRGLGCGAFVLASADLILSCLILFGGLQLLADIGLGAAVGIASAGVFRIFQK